MQACLTQGAEALRAMITLRQCWHEHNEIYLNQGCLHCGSAATYLIYFSDRDIQKLMLNFIARFSCHLYPQFDFLDLEGFDTDYQQLLNQLENLVISYAFSQHQPRRLAFEQVESIFERPSIPYCLSA
ncbi:MAG TPA: hypothetical protein PLX05_07730 [Acinetobacter parvus]|uniref:hypothetical protein n=1 Tax=Acinetobacter parvus TaxID=134533 RepID=UPI002C36B4C3|nr:hypothetical protein [Acinetobacter parvus]HRM15507.1 hypothetical protein [Acinetobacter parvus]